jgi:hypothetical protein
MYPFPGGSIGGILLYATYLLVDGGGRFSLVGGELSELIDVPNDVIGTCKKMCNTLSRLKLRD